MYGKEEEKKTVMPLPEMSIISPFLCVTQEAGIGLGHRATGSGQRQCSFTASSKPAVPKDAGKPVRHTPDGWTSFI